MNSINTKQLIEKLKMEKLNIIDIRESYEYQIGRIPTAKNINRVLLMQTPQSFLNKEEIYYIYCNSGSSSGRLVERLNLAGYHTVNIAGGYNNYLLEK